MAKTDHYGTGLLLRMHPLQRVGMSLLFAGGVFFLIKNAHNNPLFIITATWAAFAFSFLVSSWIILFSRKVDQIKRYAKKEDGSRSFVLLFTVIASFAAMVTVLLLVTGADKNEGKKILFVTISFLSVILSWVMVHTILTFHYAHLYYDDDDDDAGENKHVGGLDFPDCKDPDYIDFAYFSFVVGMTFQVSDVQVTNKKMRRLVLAHGLISFLLNTFVVALTVNFIAGLSK